MTAAPAHPRRAGLRGNGLAVNATGRAITRPVAITTLTDPRHARGSADQTRAIHGGRRDLELAAADRCVASPHPALVQVELRPQVGEGVAIQAPRAGRSAGAHRQQNPRRGWSAAGPCGSVDPAAPPGAGSRSGAVLDDNAVLSAAVGDGLVQSLLETGLLAGCVSTNASRGKVGAGSAKAMRKQKSRESHAVPISRDLL